jgi:glycosyltransferase involved in cell wall biosynthesis
MPGPSISIIIATTCEAGRASLLTRSIASVLSQDGVTVELIVVVNGRRFDRPLLDSIKRDERLKTLYIEEGNVSHARFAGLNVATGEFFGFLDDDDEFLPHALQTRTRAMLADADIDVVATNGFIHDNADELLVQPGFSRRIREDPVASFLELNWFPSPSSTFRRAAVDTRHFDIPYKYFELTYLFFRLVSAGKRIGYIDDVTYRINQDHPSSVSRSHEYALALPGFLLDVMALPLPSPIREGLHRKYLAALNGSSRRLLAIGDFANATRMHLRCLRAGGWRYLPYTRYILGALVHRTAGGDVRH